ncbi:DNA repair exonuclease [Thermoplasmatales archaeon ex4484_30]|nr:MAG: DNA repair exonuclease [Thermoplasmatales archaeon ex4484_30]
MRILHVSDSHLGYSAYHKIAENGLNQREVDVYNSFKQFVDYAIEKKPDLIIHSGDFFDSVRPTNRALFFALQQLLKISDAEIPFIILSGNHETPKMRETGSVFRLFEHIPYIYPIYKGKLEEIEIGNAIVHAIPHCFSNEDLKKNIENVKKRENFINILVLHVGIIGIKEFRRGDFNEQIIPSGCLPIDFDYIALGHYHKATQVTENAYYAGSTEYFSFKEAGEQKGFYDVEINRKVNFIPLKVRQMINLGAIDCSLLSPEEITHEIIRRADEEGVDGKIVRIELKKIGRGKYKALNWERIKKLASSALHFEMPYEFFEMEQELRGRSKIGNLEEEWREYIASVPIGGNKKEIEELALKYLHEVSR